MKDPHVESLRYRLEVNEAFGRFEAPPPLEHENAAYRMRLADGVLTVEMKEHHATLESARQQVEGDLRAWELDTALESDRPSWLHFVYDEAGTRIVDRQQPIAAHGQGSGQITLSEMACAGVGRAEPPVLSAYPVPPALFAASFELEVMISRYSKAIFDDSQMLPFGYTFLSWLEGSTGVKKGARSKVCQQYRFEPSVRSTLGGFRFGAWRRAASEKTRRQCDAETTQPEGEPPGCGQLSRCLSAAKRPTTVILRRLHRCRL